MEAVAQRVGGKVQITKYRCTEDNCGSIVKRIDKHIKQVHEMVKDTPLYNAAMDRSKLPANQIVTPRAGDDDTEDEHPAPEAEMEAGEVDAGGVNAGRVAAGEDSDATIDYYHSDDNELQYTFSDEY